MAKADESISVAMAVCNGEKYLPMQIESIVNQLHMGDELVISYDKSADNSLGIVKDYAKKYQCIRVLHNEVPGIVSNFNNAIKNCRKEIVFISDQDDLWLSGKRDTVVERMANSDADLIIHNGVHINNKGEVISEPFFAMYKIGNNIIKNFLMPRYSGCCMAIRRRALKYILPLPETVINYDHWIGMACELFGQVEFIDEVLLKHRLHDNNVTTSRRPLLVVAAQRANLIRELIKRKTLVDN